MKSCERPTANAAVQAHGGFYCPLSDSQAGLARSTLWYSRQVSSAGSNDPASAIMDGSGPPAQRVDASLPM